MKRLFFALCLCACLWLSGCASEREEPAPALTSAVSVTAAPAASSAPRPENTPEAEDPLIEASKQAALLYRDTLFGQEADFSQGEIYLDLKAGQLRAVMDVLAGAGYAANELYGTEPMTNPQLVYDFFEAVEAGDSATLTLFEITQEGGFLRRDFVVAEGERALTMTRLVWKLGEPVVTYSETYELTELSLTDGCVACDYLIPNNPEGSTHDGHIETYTVIRVN